MCVCVLACCRAEVLVSVGQRVLLSSFLPITEVSVRLQHTTLQPRELVSTTGRCDYPFQLIMSSSYNILCVLKQSVVNVAIVDAITFTDVSSLVTNTHNLCFFFLLIFVVGYYCCNILSFPCTQLITLELTTHGGAISQCSSGDVPGCSNMNTRIYQLINFVCFFFYCTKCKLVGNYNFYLFVVL